MSIRKNYGVHSALHYIRVQMMEGFLDATSGSIWIEGHSMRSSMAGTAGLVGICPQHDLLWGSLTGREHLLFYARLHAFKVISAEYLVYMLPRRAALLAQTDTTQSESAADIECVKQHAFKDKSAVGGSLQPGRKTLVHWSATVFCLTAYEVRFAYCS